MLTIMLSALALLVASLGIAHAQTPQVKGIEFADFGIYTLDREIQGRDEAGIARASGSNVRHAASLRTIPAHIGVTFGFHYRIIGTPLNIPVQLRSIVVFPEHGIVPSHAAEPVTQAGFMLQTRIGQPSFMTYTLEDAFELVPGPWAIEIWYGDRKLGTQNFELIDAASTCQAGTCMGF